MFPHSSRVQVTAVVGIYNLVQNRLLPGWLYVPANVLVSGGLIAFARRNGCNWRELGLDPANIRSGIRVGLTALGAVAAVGLMAVSRPEWRRHLRHERTADQDGGDILHRLLVRFPVGTALFEEVAFRGVVEGVWVHTGATEHQASSASAVLFGLWHLIPTIDMLKGSSESTDLGSTRTPGAGAVAGAAVTGLASLGFSWLRRRSGSLLAPWLAHAAISCAGYLAGVFSWRRQPAG